MDFEKFLVEEGFKIPKTSEVAWSGIRLGSEGEEISLLYRGKLSPSTTLCFHDPEPKYGGYFSFDTIENMLKDGWKVVGFGSD